MSVHQPRYPSRQTRPAVARPAPGGSALGQVATMRAAHADRERTVDVLNAAFAEGRLSPAEYEDRLDLAHRSQTYGELAAIVQDLPSGPVPGAYLAQAPAAFAGHPSVADYPQPYVSPYAASFARPRRISGLARTAMTLGLLQLLTFGLTAVPALVCGHVARAQIRERDEDGDSMAVAGIVLGWLGVALWAFVLVLIVFLGSSVESAPAPR